MKNETDIWMPFFIGDYLKKTSRLSTVQHGIYLLLIFDYWVNGKLPDDDETLSRIAKLDLETFRNHKPIISSFFQIADGHWKHSRIDEEISNANENKQKRHERAQKGAVKRWNRASSNASSIQQAMLNECPSPSPSPSSSNTYNKSVQNNNFEAFYSEYPKKKARAEAEKAFKKLDPSSDVFEKIIQGVKKAKLTKDWQKDGGQFIPLPATYLNQRRWEDELVPSKREDEWK